MKLRKVGDLYRHKSGAGVPESIKGTETLEPSCFYCGQHVKLQPVYVKEEGK